MQLEEQKAVLLEKKDIIKSIFQKEDEIKIDELKKVIADPKFSIFTAWDTQLMLLIKCYQICLAEKKYGEKQTILHGISSLDQMEKLYTELKFIVLRFENNMPEEFLQEGIEYIRENHISGIALFQIIKLETWKRAQNTLKLAKALKQAGMLMTATVLLYLAAKSYESNKGIIMELADCWMEGKQWKQAYDTLKQIKKPSKEIKEIMEELEKVVGYETV